jgi:hypothetical protein
MLYVPDVFGIVFNNDAAIESFINSLIRTSQFFFVEPRVFLLNHEINLGHFLTVIVE